MAQATKKSSKSTGAKSGAKSNGSSSNGSSSNGNGSGVLDNVRDLVTKNPAADRLVSELQDYARNRAQGLVDSLGDRIGDTAGRLEDFASNGGGMKKAAKSVSEGNSPLKAGAKAAATGLKDKVTGMLGGGGGGSSDGVKSTSIAESIEVGGTASVAYNQWTQFEEFGRFTKGVKKVDQKDETTTDWTAKIAFSTRTWKATVTEQVPDQRIAWTAEGDKGSVDGVVTFHELAPNLPKVLLELEYHPQGLFERTGNLWRAQGRRARLDLKTFRRFVMMRGEETGSWRGEIEYSEVSRSPEEVEKEERRQKRSGSDNGESQDGGRRRGSDEGRSRRRRESSEQQGREEGRRRPGKREGGRSGRSSGGRERGGAARARAGAGRGATVAASVVVGAPPRPAPAAATARRVGHASLRASGP